MIQPNLQLTQEALEKRCHWLNVGKESVEVKTLLGCDKLVQSNTENNGSLPDLIPLVLNHYRKCSHSERNTDEFYILT